MGGRVNHNSSSSLYHWYNRHLSDMVLHIDEIIVLDGDVDISIGACIKRRE